MPSIVRIRDWAPPLVAIFIAAVLMLSGNETTQLLRYDRGAIAGGDYLRLLTGHLVHLNAGHFLLNAAGLLLVWYLVGDAFSTLLWTLIILSNIMIIDAGFWFGMPQLSWYVGLSGLLHGVLASGIVGIWRARRAEAAAITVILAAKLIYEILFGPLPGSESAAGGNVVTQAHLFGAIGGLAAGLAVSISVRRAPSI